MMSGLPTDSRTPPNGALELWSWMSGTDAGEALPKIRYSSLRMPHRLEQHTQRSPTIKNRQVRHTSSLVMRS